MFSSEAIHLDGDNTLKILIYSLNRLEMHWHDLMEVLIVLKGSINLRIGDRPYILKENDTVIINPRESHVLSLTEDENIVLTLQIRPEYFDQFYPDFRHHFLECNSSSAPDELRNKFGRIRHHVAKITWELSLKREGYRFLAGNELNSLGFHLLNHFEPRHKETAVRDTDMDRLERIIAYIKDNLEKKVTLKDIADKEFMNPYYLSHFIKNKTGLSFQEYINHLRAEKARMLLMDDELSLTNIAHECGFSSTNYFNKVYREVFNISPSQYRKKKSASTQKFRKLTLPEKMINADPQRKAVMTKIYSYINKDELLNVGLVREETIEVDLQPSVDPGPRIHWNKLFLLRRPPEIPEHDENLWMKGLEDDLGIRIDDLLNAEDPLCSLHPSQGSIDTDSIDTALWLMKEAMRQSLSEQDECPLVIDLIEDPTSTHFHGGGALVNGNGLKKASWHALALLNRLGPTVFGQGEDFVVTGDGSDMQILAVNCEGQPPYPEQGTNLSMTFHLKGIDGSYRIRRYRLDEHSGSVYDDWRNLGAPDPMTREEIRYLKGKSWPKMTTGFLSPGSNASIQVNLPPKGAELICLHQVKPIRKQTVNTI